MLKYFSPARVCMCALTYIHTHTHSLTHNNAYITHRHDFSPFFPLPSSLARAPGSGSQPSRFWALSFLCLVSLVWHFQNKYSIAGIKRMGDLLPSDKRNDWELKPSPTWLSSAFSMLIVHFHAEGIQVTFSWHLGFIFVFYKSSLTAWDELPLPSLHSYSDFFSA